MYRLRVALASGCFIACNSPSQAPRDAIAIDGPADGAVDASIDSALDAPLDAAPDAPSTSPACASGASTLFDVAPREISGLSSAGDMLYVSAYVFDGSSVTDTVVHTVDLTTGQEVGAPFPTAYPQQLSASEGDVYGVDRTADGTIWRYHPGSAPEAVVEHRLGPGAVVTDDGYIYWTEPASGDDGMVKRRLMSGGPVADIMACKDAYQLLISGSRLYCLMRTSIYWGLKTGSLPQSITGINSILISAGIIDGGDLYFVSVGAHHQLYRVDAFGSSATLFKEEPEFGRPVGLAATSDYFYTVDGSAGVRRIHKTTRVTESIVSSLLTGYGPVLWHDELFYTEETPTNAHQRYVKHCVD